MSDFTLTEINDRWPLMLPTHRAERAEWSMENGGWEAPRLASMHDHLGPDSVIIDVGAEMGDLPCLYASWGAKVILIEPNPKVWTSIRMTFEANGLEDHVLAWWVGFASDTNAMPNRCPIQRPYGTIANSGWPECSTLPLDTAAGFRHLSQETDVTPQITLDDLVAKVDVVPTALTIDCEGSELVVLRGARLLLSIHRPTVWVSIHTDRQWMDEMYGGVNEDDVHALMAEFGYVPTVLGEDHELHVLYQPAERVGL